jgi:elongation factor Tu
MSKAKFERTKPHVNIGTIGHVDHGKTTLTAAITKVPGNPRPGRVQGLRLHRQRSRRARARYHHRHRPRRVRDREAALRHVDCPGHADYIKNMITGAAQMDGAILVVPPPTARCPRPASTSCSPVRSAFPPSSSSSTSADMVDDEELLELVEMEVRELLSKYEFPGDDIPDHPRLALKALENGCGNPSARSASASGADGRRRQLHPEPEREIDKPFLMPVEDVFSISGRGTVAPAASSAVSSRSAKNVEIVGHEGTKKTVVTGVEMFRKLLDQGQAGDNVGILLRGVKRDDIERGQVLAKPGSITPHTKFKARSTS